MVARPPGSARSDTPLLLPACTRAAYGRYIYIGSGAGPWWLLLQSGTHLLSVVFFPLSYSAGPTRRMRMARRGPARASTPSIAPHTATAPYQRSPVRHSSAALSFSLALATRWYRTRRRTWACVYSAREVGRRRAHHLRGGRLLHRGQAGPAWTAAAVYSGL